MQDKRRGTIGRPHDLENYYLIKNSKKVKKSKIEWSGSSWMVGTKANRCPYDYADDVFKHLRSGESNAPVNPKCGKVPNSTKLDRNARKAEWKSNYNTSFDTKQIREKEGPK